KVLLAELTDEQIESYVQRSGGRAYTARTITRRPGLQAELVDVRKNGIAYDEGEFGLEVRCAAVPVYSFTGQVAGAIGISCPIWRLSLQAFQEMTSEVRASAEKLTGLLGGVTPRNRLKG